VAETFEVVDYEMEMSGELENPIKIGENKRAIVLDLYLMKCYCGELVVYSDNGETISQVSGDVIGWGYLPNPAKIEKITGWKWGGTGKADESLSQTIKDGGE